ncbi:MAG: arginine N-succinyltransferase [Myxococcaceae bacterium]
MIRNARVGDANGLRRLAVLLNTTNLPDEPGGLEEILHHSCDSFEGKIENPFERLYLFVLEDTRTGQVIGSSQIIAQHGTPELPHVYFQIESLNCHSETLGQTFGQKILILGFNSTGVTEVGGLILDPEYRHVPQKLGRALSLVRFWFIERNKNLFRERLLAELLPPFDASGQSPLWFALGRHFMSLSYREADHLSRKQKEFIEALFPSYPIYVSLLPEEAQAVIGRVGEGSQPAAHLLAKLGFKFENRVDPFDGGPHFEMLTQDLKPVELDPEIRLELI